MESCLAISLTLPPTKALQGAPSLMCVSCPAWHAMMGKIASEPKMCTWFAAHPQPWCILPNAIACKQGGQGPNMSPASEQYLLSLLVVTVTSWHPRHPDMPPCRGAQAPAACCGLAHTGNSHQQEPCWGSTSKPPLTWGCRQRQALLLPGLGTRPRRGGGRPGHTCRAGDSSSGLSPQWCCRTSVLDRSEHSAQKGCCLIAHTKHSCCCCAVSRIVWQLPSSHRRKGRCTNKRTRTAAQLLQPQASSNPASCSPRGLAHLGLLSGSPRKRRTDSLRSLWGTCTCTRTAAGAGGDTAGVGARDVDAPTPVEGRGGLRGVATPSGPPVMGAHGSARGCFPTPEPAGRRVPVGSAAGFDATHELQRTPFKFEIACRCFLQCQPACRCNQHSLMRKCASVKAGSKRSLQQLCRGM